MSTRKKQADRSWQKQAAEYMKEVLPNPEETEIFKKELLEIVVDVTEFLPDVG